MFLSIPVRMKAFLAGRTTGPAQLSHQGCARSSTGLATDRYVHAVDGMLAAGVVVVAAAGLLLGFAVGTREPGVGTVALYAALFVPLALAAALTAGRRHGQRGGTLLHRASLAAVTLAGAILCFRGLDFALPYVPHPDEPVVVDLAQRMLKSGDLNPHRFVYPSLYVYLQALVYALHLGWGYSQGLYGGVGELPDSTARITTAPGFYLWGRALTALLATGSILLVYGSGRRLYGRRAGLLAALLLAFAAPVIADAHLVTVDVPAMALTALGFFWIVALYRAPPRQDGTLPLWPVVRAGIGVGLATATKYNAAVLAAPLALLPLLRGVREPWRVWLAGGLAAAAAFCLVTPFAVFDLPTFLGDTASVVTHYRFEGHAGWEGDHNWLFYADYLWSSGRWTFALALLGLLVMACRHRRADLLVLPFPLLYYGVLSGLKVNFYRNLLPLYPFLALAGAVGLLAAARWLASRGAGRRARAEGRGARGEGRGPRGEPQRLLAGVSVALRPSPLALRPALVALTVLPLALGGPAATAGQLDNLRARTDSRVAAQRWMEGNLSRGVYWLVQLPPQQWYRLGNVVTSDVFGPLQQHPPEWYPRHGFGYLLLDFNEYGAYLDDPASFPREAAWYTEALARFPTVRVFGGAGPQVTLLSTGLGGGAMQHGSAARFGAGDGEVALLGYNLGSTDQPHGPYFPGDGGDAGAAPGPYRAGGKVGLTLLWRALRTPGSDYQVFVHLRDEGGRTVAQRDTRPQNDGYPTTAWRAGDFVLDDASLPLPATLPPGRYTIVLGFYPLGRPRLPVRPGPGLAPAPDDELTLATIEVGR